MRDVHKHELAKVEQIATRVEVIAEDVVRGESKGSKEDAVHVIIGMGENVKEECVVDAALKVNVEGNCFQCEYGQGRRSSQQYA